MTIKCRKKTRGSILYFTGTFTVDEKMKLQDRSYDIKCHLISLRHILNEYTLSNITKNDLYLKVIYRQNDNPNQKMVISINLTSEGQYDSFHILLDYTGSKSNVYAPNFRPTASANVENVLQSIINRQVDIHCDSCVNKYKKQISRMCRDIYKHKIC